MTAFNGFTSQTVSFLSELENNNSKAWFDDNRDRYKEHYLEPAKDFVAAIGPHLQKMDPRIQAEPRVNGSIFRVNRDVRFSKDKTPYKPHIDLWFWVGDRKAPISGLFLRLAPQSLILGAGAMGFTPDQLKTYRQAIVGPAGLDLLRIEKSLAKDELSLVGEHYKKLPRGFSTENDDIGRLLRFNGLHTMREETLPAALGTSDFIEHCVSAYKPMLPLHNWLMKKT